MITLLRSASIASGKTVSAIGWAKETAAYIKDKLGIHVSVVMPVGGNPSRVAWSAQYADLAALESGFNKLLADPKYLEMITRGAENFIAGSVHDEIWRTI
jgi:uncharacterized protein YbjT (DUF2867 family)